MTIYLVRHGKDDETIRGGWSNHGLMPVGVEQVNKLAKEIVAANMNIEYIYIPAICKERKKHLKYYQSI